MTFCILSGHYNGMRLLEILGRGECILHLGGTCVTGGEREGPYHTLSLPSIWGLPVIIVSYKPGALAHSACHFPHWAATGEVWSLEPLDRPRRFASEQFVTRARADSSAKTDVNRPDGGYWLQTVRPTQAEALCADCPSVLLVSPATTCPKHCGQPVRG